MSGLRRRTFGTAWRRSRPERITRIAARNGIHPVHGPLLNSYFRGVFFRAARRRRSQTSTARGRFYPTQANYSTAGKRPSSGRAGHRFQKPDAQLAPRWIARCLAPTRALDIRSRERAVIATALQCIYRQPNNRASIQHPRDQRVKAEQEGSVKIPGFHLDASATLQPSARKQAR